MLTLPIASTEFPADRADGSPSVAADLNGFFTPRRVALIGASESSDWTRFVLDGTDRSPGLTDVALVNPARRTVLHRPTVATLADLDERPDLAFVMVGAPHVESVVGTAIGLGVRDFVVLTAGFGEADAAGAQAQRRLAELCRAAGSRLLGPNVSGFVNAAAGVRMFGLPVPADLPAGRMGVVLQSGGLATHVLGLARTWGVGISLLATSGNEAELDATDLFAHLVDDPGTDAIAVFLESVRRPAVFQAAALRAAEAGKPVVALHVGRSALGRMAALSHTGALVGDHDAALAALADVGVVTVHSLEELVATTALLTRHPRGLQGRRIAVVAASGGACELIADAADAHAMTLPPFPPPVTDRLRAALPGFAEARNPLDVTGFVVKAADLPFTATELVGTGAAADFDVLILQSVVLPAQRGPDADAVDRRFGRLAEAIARCPIPVVLQTAATYALSPFALELIGRHGLNVLPGVEAGIAALAGAARLVELREHALRDRDHDPAVLSEYRDRTADPTDPADLTDLAVACGLRFPPRRLAATADEAAWAAQAIGFPVVVKIVSPDIAHKSDVGGVRLALDLPEQVALAVADMLATVHDRRPDARITGVEVAAMRPPGTELLVSVVQDARWGPMLTIGAGGVLSELITDVVTLPLPVSAPDVLRAMDRLRIARLLAGYRGGRPADRTALAAAMLAVVRLHRALGPGVRAVEVNPLQVDGDRIEALDLLVESAPAGPSTLPK